MTSAPAKHGVRSTNERDEDDWYYEADRSVQAQRHVCAVAVPREGMQREEGLHPQRDHRGSNECERCHP